MPTTMGVYTAAETAGTEVSSTYEGRHLTVLETELIHPDHTDDLVDKGDPVIIVLADATNPHETKGHAVGVALASATAVTDYIAVDTEGIWNLTVYAFDDSGGATGVVNPGDPLYISDDSAESDDSGLDGTGDAVISKIKNRNIQVPFGYALGQIDSAANGVIAVKVHWDPSVPEETVGADGAEWASAVAAKKFREYYYAASGGGIDIQGERMELTITSSCATCCVDYRRLNITDDPTVVTGRCSVIEARLNITGAGALNLPTMGVLVLDYDNEGSASPNNFVNAYIMLRDRSGDVLSCRTLFHFHDKTALADGAEGHNSQILCDSVSDQTSNARIHCTYGVGSADVWILCTTNAPD